MNAVNLMNGDKLFKKHHEKVRKELAVAAKAKQDTITDDQVKAQIAKGWVMSDKHVVCIGCARKIAKNPEELAKKKNLVCTVCPVTWTV